jgi:alkanesulfonate monooxygenase SsuD/methylene tetrahydromethanopterin reductase-like flavin-dependent oxidoreductase (luciferase family)
LNAPEFFLFLPQMRLPFPALVDRARDAEAAGFRGIALMDHMAPPLGEGLPMHEALIAATWVAAHTTTLEITHLVLCDAFRAPALLAKQAVALDHASGGRFELGIGAGSLPGELASFGLHDPGGRARRRQLGETLEVLKLLWSGEPVHFDGEFHKLDGAQQQPTPLDRIPIVVGGAGDALVELAAAHADWWNLPMYALDRLEELRPRTAPARTSLQQMVAYVADESSRAETVAVAARRFAYMPGEGPLVADAAELRERFAALCEQGVERFYVWFTDFAVEKTLRGFGEEVVAGLTR